MAPKLTPKHLELPSFMSMRVHLATQILSHSVTAGISTLVTLNHLPTSAMKTAEFVEQFDTLFNAFNSKSMRSTRKMGHAFKEGSGHKNFLRESQTFLGTIKTQDGRELPCIVGWKICINALFSLWEHLKEDSSFKFLLTSRFNQDCIENLFGVMRGRGHFNDNPDCRAFKASFKFVVADKLFVHSSGANCKADNDQILLDLATLAMSKDGTQNPKAREEKDVHAGADIADISVPLSLPTQNVAAYIAGYLLRKVSLNGCETCTRALVEENPSSPQEKLELIKQKAFSGKETSLVYPTITMQQFVEKLEGLFVSTFEWIIYMPSLLARLCNSAKVLYPGCLCTDKTCKENLGRMVKLFMKVRVFHALKTSNLANSTKASRKNRKVLKLSHM